MKTSVKIMMLLLAFFFGLSMALGQGKGKVPYQERKMTQQPDWILPVEFNACLHPDFRRPFPGQTKALRIQQNNNDITIDTVVVNSYYENPERYIYTYSDGNLTGTLNQVQNNNNTWQNVTLNVCVYDTLGNKLVSIWENWKDSAWVNSARNSYTYGPDRTLLSSFGEIWDQGKWEKSDTTSYTYDIYGHLLSTYKQVWNDSTWVNNIFEIATYDSLGNMLNLTRNTWNDSLGWFKNQQYDYTYDTNHNVLSATIKNGVDFQWQNFYRELYSYDSANNKISYTGQFWRNADSTWVNSQKYLYTYNSIGRLTNALGMNWDTTGTSWVNYVNAQYTHDLYGGIESDYIQRWNDRDSVWADSALTQYVYDKFGDAIRGDYYTSDGKTWVINQDGPLEIAYNYNINQLYFVGYHVAASYSTPSAEGVENIKNPLSSFICSPNPVSEQSVIRLVLKEKASVNLSLYNMNGKMIENIYKGTLLKGSYQYSFSLGSLPAGVYFATFSTPEFVKSIKIVWMH